MMTNRKFGYTGQVLNHDALVSKVMRILEVSYGLTEEELTSLVVPEYLLLDAGTHRLAVVRTEGVGTSTNDGAAVRVGVDLGGMYADYYQVELSPRVLRQLATSEERDLADWVRTFGARLDNNVASWQRWMDAK